MKYIIDRFEESFAVCEDEQGNMINIERNMLPEQIVEGDIIYYVDDIIYKDEEATKKRQEEIEKLTHELWID